MTELEKLEMDEELIDYFIEKLQDGCLSNNEDVLHFICKIREIEKEVKEQAVIINFLKKRVAEENVIPPGNEKTVQGT